MKDAATTFGRILLGLLLCLGLLRAETGLAEDCRTELAPKPCACCVLPESGCCAAIENQAPAPVPVPPRTITADPHLDIALVHRPVLFVLPVAPACHFPKSRADTTRVSSGHSRQSLLCLRTV